MAELEADSRVVLDASAVLALLFAEPGEDRVRAVLDRSVMSAVNWHEVIAKLIDRGVTDDEIADIAANLPVEIVVVDQKAAEAGARLRASTRAGGLSLGDRSCLALAQSLRAVAYTTDRSWAVIADAVRLEVELIR